MSVWMSALLTVVLVAADRLTKWLAAAYLKGSPCVLWEGVFELHYAENDGIAWGMLGGSRWILVALTLAVMAVLAWFLFTNRDRYGRLFSVSLVLIIAGGLGNLIDRVFCGYVVDFLYVRLIDFPIFNVADCCVTIGAAMLLIWLLFFSDMWKGDAPKEGSKDGTPDVDGTDRGDGGAA